MNILSEFRILHYEVLKLKAWAMRELDGSFSKIDTPKANENKDEGKAEYQDKYIDESESFLHQNSQDQESFFNIFDEIKRKIINILDERKLSFARNRMIPPKQAREALYAMVSYVDEVFLNFEWNGIKYWENSMLEAYFFQTQIAGELIFKKIDIMLQSYEVSQKEMAELYFTILSLGFKGQYRGQQYNKDQKDQYANQDYDIQDDIKFYMENLYVFIYGKNPKKFNKDYLLFEQTYQHTLSEQSKSYLPSIKIWTMGIASAFMVYLFLTYVLWYKVSNGIYQYIDFIGEEVLK